jgi:peptidyl-prolyl cis-trans isomerase C
MKFCVLVTCLAAALCAQAPVPPDAVVMKVEGKPVTAAETRKIVESGGPQFYQQFQQNPSLTIAQYYVMQYLAVEAEKHKLLERSPWKEQFDFMRNQFLTNASVTNELNSHAVSSDQIDAYYSANRSRYEQAKIKVISIAFKPGMPTNPTPEQIKQAAQEAFQSAHATAQRSEADARKLAVDLVKQLREGADFAALVAKYSDDKDSKANGGDFGTVKINSPYPEDLKRTVFALKPGEVGDPVRQAAAFYVIRVEEKSVQPLAEVREAIILDIRNDYVRKLLADLQKKFEPAIEKPEFFLQFQGKQPVKP